VILSLLLACNTHHAVMGTVTDRNGEPVDRVIIKLDPGNVQLVTDQNGYYEIDYLRDDETGERTKFGKRTIYEVEAFKPGFHVQATPVEYKRGELIVEPIVLKEDTIRVVGTDENIDPASQPQPTEADGASYQGE
jgi:hypothetical protein